MTWQLFQAISIRLHKKCLKINHAFQYVPCNEECCFLFWLMIFFHGVLVFIWWSCCLHLMSCLHNYHGCSDLWRSFKAINHLLKQNTNNNMGKYMYRAAKLSTPFMNSESSPWTWYKLRHFLKVPLSYWEKVTESTTGRKWHTFYAQAVSLSPCRQIHMFR